MAGVHELLLLRSTVFGLRVPHVLLVSIQCLLCRLGRLIMVVQHEIQSYA